MQNLELPAPIANYILAKAGENGDLDCFAENATVWDNGEDTKLEGLEQIREWMAGTVAGYDLTYEVVSIEPRGSEFVTGVIVSGNFPGSPYKFENRFRLEADKIVELVIDPVGPVVE